MKCLFQLRVGLRPLRYDKKRHNFADTSSEICECGAGPEDASHYLFFCSNFHAQRAQLMNQVIPLLRNYNLMQYIHSPCLFLYGDKSISDSDNKTIISSPIEYILESEKFGTYPPPTPLTLFEETCLWESMWSLLILQNYCCFCVLYVILMLYLLVLMIKQLTQ